MGHICGVNWRKSLGNFMVEWHYKSKRKPSGGILKTLKRADKKLASRGGVFAQTTIAKDEKEIRIDAKRVIGGNIRQKAKKVLFANVIDGKKAIKAKILGVIENSANRLYTRRNIITKGAFIKIQLNETEKTAKVTSRPGQDGMVNAIIAEVPIKPKKVKKEQKQKETSPKTTKEEPKTVQTTKTEQNAENVSKKVPEKQG